MGHVRKLKLGLFLIVLDEFLGERMDTNEFALFVLRRRMLKENDERE